MKKMYVMPKTKLVNVKVENLLVQYSGQQADKNATTLSRESKWDDED